MKYKIHFAIIIIVVLMTWSVVYNYFYVPDLEKFKTVALGTYVEITYPEVSLEKKKTLEQGFLAVLNKINSDLSVYKKNSLVSKLNRDGSIIANDTLLYVLKRASEASELSGGAFDITAQPLIELWQNAREQDKMPDSNQIARNKQKVGYKNLVINDNQVILKNGARINLGGIAKGYAIDLIERILRENGVYNALVNIGGDIKALGTGPKYNGWKIGIAHPRKKGQVLFTINVRNKAVATSGDYERFSFVNGQRISHIIDPRSGTPASTGIVSVTISADSAVQADALATAVFVLGQDKGLALIDNLEAVEAMLVTSEGEKCFSNNWPYSRGY